MFVKLFKHDFRASWGLLGILSLIALGAGAAGSGLIRYFQDGSRAELLQVMGFIAMAAVVLYLIAYGVVALFLLMGQFYKSCFTDEGYLTFTLPVTTHQILLSSFLNCFLGMLASILVVIVSFGIFFFFGLPSLDGERMEVIRLCFEMLPEIIDLTDVGNILLGLLAILTAMAGELLTIMLAITVGSVVVKKHKLLMAVVFYYVIGIVKQTVLVLGGAWLASSGAAELVSGLTEEMGMTFFQNGTLLVFTVCAVGAIVCYFVMYYLTHKKLNLN